MIKDEQLPELPAYRQLESELPLWYAPKYGNLVVASSNDDHAVHRWFRFKEGFAADLLGTVLSTLELPKDRKLTLLDPFCGSGTTLLSAETLNTSAAWNLDAIGVEINPFIAFVAQTKLAWADINPEALCRAGETALVRARHAAVSLPELSSISEGRCISRSVARRLIALRGEIKKVRNQASRQALLLGIASAIEPLSKVRKDGRALRIVEKPSLDLEATVREKWRCIAQDVSSRRETCNPQRTMSLIKGDGRDPAALGVAPRSIDVIVTSPPYPNNIDYTEVYKLELWLLGFVNSGEEFLGLRRQTLRSHPTAAALPTDAPIWSALKNEPLRSLVHPLLLRMEKDKDAARKRLLLGYCNDVIVGLSNHYALLKPGGYEVIVVGNSLHGSGDHAFLLPSDLLIAAIAMKVGFTVREVNIARGLKRRLSGNHFLRESVLILRRPHATT